MVEVPPKKPSSLRSTIGVSEDVFIYGMHQGNREDIFSRVPLEAYSKIESDQTCFVMLGGANKYKEQAKELNLKNCYFLDFNANVEDINDFVEGLDVFAHGRLDGEVCSAAIIEALYHGKPCVSHPALNHGHLEQLAGCGIICNSLEIYAEALKELKQNKEYYNFLSTQSLTKWEEVYKLEKCVERYADIYKET